VLFATSQLKSGVVHFKPVATSPIGSVTGNQEQSDEIVSLLDNPYFRFHFDADIETICWKKALSNIVFNSICPLLEIDNGVFARNPEVMELADQVIAQCLQVARQKGIELTAREIHDTVLMISQASDGQDISTLQDIRLGRETEIDTLNMELCRLAEEAGLSDLVRETWLLGRMIQLKAALHAKQKIIS
jgi:2-dehydropantoate 2-reductase